LVFFKKDKKSASLKTPLFYSKGLKKDKRGGNKGSGGETRTIKRMVEKKTPGTK